MPWHTYIQLLFTNAVFIQWEPCGRESAQRRNCVVKFSPPGVVLVIVGGPNFPHSLFAPHTNSVCFAAHSTGSSTHRFCLPLKIALCEAPIQRLPCISCRLPPQHLDSLWLNQTLVRMLWVICMDRYGLWALGCSSPCECTVQNLRLFGKGPRLFFEVIFCPQNNSY